MTSLHFAGKRKQVQPPPSFPEGSKKAGAKREAALRVHAEQSCSASSFRTKEPGLSPRWAETCPSRTGPPTNGPPLVRGVRRAAPHMEAEAALPRSWAVLTSPSRSDPYKGKRPACPRPRPGPAGCRQPRQPLPRVPGAWAGHGTRGPADGGPKPPGAGPRWQPEAEARSTFPLTFRLHRDQDGRKLPPGAVTPQPGVSDSTPTVSGRRPNMSQRPPYKLRPQRAGCSEWRAAPGRPLHLSHMK